MQDDSCAANPKSSRPQDEAHGHLNGWKEIAAHFGRTPRTVQRWEHERGFPVHRLAGGAMEAVFALKSEIDAWKGQAAGLDADTAAEEVESPPEEATGATGQIGSAFPAAPLARRIVRHPAFVVAMLVVAFALLLAVYRGAGPQAPPPDAALAGDPSLQLRWQAKGGNRSETRLADGTVLDPAFAVLDTHGIVFDYERRAASETAHPWMVAVLDRPLRSPCLQFRYVPHNDGRVAHLLGFASSEPFTEEPRWAHPRNGIAMWLGRSAANTNDSTVGLVEFVDGVPDWLSNAPLPFQLTPGREYACTLLIEGPSITATVSDGATAGRVTDQPSRPPAPFGQVFVADFEHGVSATAPPGRYRLRFEEVTVTDRIYRIAIELWPAAGQRRITALAATLSVALFSISSLNMAALDESSIRLNGVGVRRGASAQGYACRAEAAHRDGILGLVCEFDASTLALRPGRREFTLEARTGGSGRSWEHRVAWVRGRVAIDIKR